MSGSEMGNREPFTIDLHNMRLDYAATAADGTPLFNNPLQLNASPNFHPSTAVTAAPININGSGAGAESVAVTQPHVGTNTEAKKKKRGRPRKYGPDGSVGPTSPAVGLNQNLNQSGRGGPVSPGIASAPPNAMKRRGRPRGSRNKHRHFRGSGKVPYSTHVITVKTGEDLSMRIGSLTTNGPRNVCILSANGTISNVTLSQPTVSGRTVTYEGRFEILALRGSLLLSGDGHYQRAGSLSLTLAGPDGRVLGGGIVGVCIAASPIQMVLMSFAVPGHKDKGYVSANQIENFSAPPPAGQSSSPSQGTFSESSGEEGSPLDLSAEACNNNNIPQGGISGMFWK